MTAVLFLSGGISVPAITFAGSGLSPFLEITSLKNAIHVHPVRHFSLFSFKLACLHLHNTCSKLTS